MVTHDVDGRRVRFPWVIVCASRSEGRTGARTWDPDLVIGSFDGPASAVAWIAKRHKLKAKDAERLRETWPVVVGGRRYAILVADDEDPRTD